MPGALLQTWLLTILRNLTTMLLIPRSFLFVCVSLPRTNRKLCQTVVKHAFHSLHCTRMQKIWSTWSTQACSMTAPQVHKSAALSIGEFRIPGRPRTSDCFCAKARLMRVTSPTKKTNKHEETAADLPKKGKFEKLKGFGGLKAYLQAWEITVSNSKRKSSSSSLRKTKNLTRNRPKWW